MHPTRSIAPTRALLAYIFTRRDLLLTLLTLPVTAYTMRPRAIAPGRRHADHLRGAQKINAWATHPIPPDPRLSFAFFLASSFPYFFFCFFFTQRQGYDHISILLPTCSGLYISFLPVFSCEVVVTPRLQLRERERCFASLTTAFGCTTA